MALKVYQLLASHKWTGPAEGVVTLTRDLRERGHEVRLFCTPNERRLLADRAEVRGVVPEGEFKLEANKILGSLGDIRKLKALIKKEEPDILHVHLSPDHAIGALALRKAGVRTRLVRTIHNSRTLEMRAFRGKLYGAMTDGFITLGEGDKALLLERFKVSPERVSVIHGAVDIKRFNSNMEARLGRAEFGLKMTTPVIGMVARFQKHRRHNMVISIIGRLIKNYPNLKLLLVGRGEHQEAIEEMVRNKGLDRHVIFAGYRDEDLPQVYAAMDILVFPKAGSDGSCRAVLEAMAVGRPVVAFKVGALSDTIVHGKTGCLVPEGDEKELERALEDLLYDRSTAQNMGEEARLLIESSFNETLRAERTERFYEGVLRQGKQ
ncbi:MAG TPA: glycosyltransferase family 4 protein [Nitrospiria bacterium]